MSFVKADYKNTSTGASKAFEVPASAEAMSLPVVIGQLEQMRAQTNAYFSALIKNAPTAEADLEQAAFDEMNGALPRPLSRPRLCHVCFLDDSPLICLFHSKIMQIITVYELFSFVLCSRDTSLTLV